MRITPRNILYHELVGLKARVISYPDPTITGLSGIISGETRRTILIDTGRKEVAIVKHLAVLEVEIPGWGPVVVEGELLTGSPQDRAKRMLRGR